MNECPSCGGSYDGTIIGGYCIRCGRGGFDCSCPRTPPRPFPLEHAKGPVDSSSVEIMELKALASRIVKEADDQILQEKFSARFVGSVIPDGTACPCARGPARVICPACTIALCLDCFSSHVCVPSDLHRKPTGGRGT